MEEKDKAVVDFVLIIAVNNTCGKVEDFAATWRKKREKNRLLAWSFGWKENFWLNDDLHGFFFSLRKLLDSSNEASLSTWILHPRTPTRFLAPEQFESMTTSVWSSLNTRIVDSGIGHFDYIINDANFTSKKKFQNFYAV